jgi:hypothetical protein
MIMNVIIHWRACFLLDCLVLNHRDLALQRLEVPLNSVPPTESVSMRLKLLVCLASTGVNAPETMLAKFLHIVESC